MSKKGITFVVGWKRDKMEILFSFVSLLENSFTQDTFLGYHAFVLCEIFPLSILMWNFYLEKILIFLNAQNVSSKRFAFWRQRKDPCFLSLWKEGGFFL